jgi:Kinesin motor domain
MHAPAPCLDTPFPPRRGNDAVVAFVACGASNGQWGADVAVHVVPQTGAGKTHTMEGSVEDPGVNYRAVKELFRWGGRMPEDPERLPNDFCRPLS